MTALTCDHYRCTAGETEDYWFWVLGQGYVRRLCARHAPPEEAHHG